MKLVQQHSPLPLRRRDNVKYQLEYHLLYVNQLLLLRRNCASLKVFQNEGYLSFNSVCGQIPTLK